ncbi:NAD(P)-dependent alcohol dehydrogenase [Roseivirga spongicola]|uniref:NAD(P)-dependent alcohol dehydrogenase n=1 Tax=Roseivirga spongicola TaxID=333140 RepID=UPI002AC9505F|nr:NAD(P)-dependent alcohol dehydrogenase [Roseivirga spongicola]WPZ09000.1 NAD(P)-dependent alcohol dehydrogenase [Roseivirga spongicola]
MKAYIRKKYGGPNKLQLLDFQKPSPKEDELLVKVVATSVNPADWRVMRGTPYMIRLMMGVFKPKNPFIGADVSGIVEKAGSKVTQFKPGDEVFTDVMGTGAGAFAEYVCVKASHWVSKPQEVSHKEAAATPIAGITAWQGLNDIGKLQNGQQVLINGASGGVGTFAVQIAKHIGAHITAVCSTSKVEMVRSLGADVVIDYKKNDYRKLNQQFDLIFDAVGNVSPSLAKRLLKPSGICVMVGWGGFGRFIGFSLGKLWLSKASDKKLESFTAKMKTEDLSLLAELIATNRLTPMISDHSNFKELPAAIAFQEKGHAAGKVIVTVSE